ncbi:MAG: alpha/beta hydrolase [Elainellaceae cyanobacterium]
MVDSPDTLTSIVRNAQSQPRNLLVLLHGWGANAQDVATVADDLRLPGYALAFPDAPFRHPYSPGGFMWYSFPEASLDDETKLDQLIGLEQGDLQESRQRLRAWLNALCAQLEVPLSRTILGGFSQGGAMTLDIGPQMPLARLMSLSGYLHRSLGNGDRPAPTLLVHGTQDAVVPVQAAHQAHQQLTALSASVDYHELPMGHEISSKVLNLMQSFIESTQPMID